MENERMTYIGVGYVVKNGQRVLRVGLVKPGCTIAEAYFLAYPSRGDTFTLYPEDRWGQKYGKHKISMSLVR